MNTRPKASLTLRVSEVIYNKVRDIAEKMEINMREAADVFFNDLSATIANLQRKNEDLQEKVKQLEKENQRLEREVEKWQTEAIQARKI